MDKAHSKKKKGDHYIGEPEKVEEYSLGVSMEDTQYVDAIKEKGELAIMNGEKVELENKPLELTNY